MGVLTRVARSEEDFIFCKSAEVFADFFCALCKIDFSVVSAFSGRSIFVKLYRLSFAFCLIIFFMMRTFILGVLGVLSAITAAANAVLPQTNASANGAEESRQKKADFKDIHITHGPYLHNITPTGATVIWTTDKPAVSWVEIAPEDGSHFYEKDRRKFYNAPLGKKVVETVHSIRVEGLNPATTYNYRVFSTKVLAEEGAQTYYGFTASTKVYKREPLKLKTLDTAKKTLKFSVFNDIHQKPEVAANMLSNMPENSDFILINGDMVNEMNSQEELFKYFMDAVAAHCGKTGLTMFSVRGNHETRGEFSEAFSTFFPTPTGKTYFSFRVGPVFFVAVDGGEDKPDNDIEYFGRSDFDNFRTEQARWLESVVKSEEFKSAPVKILISHIPPAWGSWHGSKDFQNKFAKTINNAGFSLIISGHLHKHIFFKPTELIYVPNIANSNTEMMNVSVGTDKIAMSFVDQFGKKTRDDIVVDVKK